MTVEVLPVEGLPEVRPGDDLAALLGDRLAETGLRDGDVVVVTQKVVSKAEGRIVPEEGEGRAAWVEREARRVVARREDLLIAETAHGFVCANAGVDASNVEAGFLTLLPEDPDASAERIRAALEARFGVGLGVLVTDTFGRAWRSGVVNVAIGCAGLPALVDLRGTPDHTGRVLEATVVALADEVAAASGLVMGKSTRVPAAIVRGVVVEAPPSPARALIRPREEDLFRESPLQSILARRPADAFAEGDVPRAAIEEAVRAALSATAPHGSRPWSFSAVVTHAARRLLVAGILEAWREDLAGDGVPADETARRVDPVEALLGAAPVLLVPWVRFDEMRRHAAAGRAHAEQERFLLSSGAAIQNLLLALHAQGYAARWAATTLFSQERTREALGMARGWFALGTVAVGPMPAGLGSPRPPDLGDLLSER